MNEKNIWKAYYEILPIARQNYGWAPAIPPFRKFRRDMRKIVNLRSYLTRSEEKVVYWNVRQKLERDLSGKSMMDILDADDELMIDALVVKRK